MSRRAEAVAAKAAGRYNCAQAVACTYCDYAGIDEKTMENLAAAFGAGMGTGQGTCGAIVGAGIVLGGFHKDRADAMLAMKTLVRTFEACHSTVVCRELKGNGTARPLCACNDCVGDAAEILETLLAESGSPVK